MTYAEYAIRRASERARSTNPAPTHQDVLNYLLTMKLYDVCDVYLSNLDWADLDSPIDAEVPA